MTENRKAQATGILARVASHNNQEEASLTVQESGLPEFHFHTLDLYLDVPIEARQRYREAVTSNISRPALGTQIWWVTMPDGTQRCLKEFYLADPVEFGRDIPDPIWRSPAPLTIPTGARRGLAAQRALLFDQMQSGTLKQEVARAGGQHADFRSQFNAYSFELESLITQFARYYGCDQLVKTSFWGPLQLQGRSGYRFAIEMERLQPLPLPPPGDGLAMIHRLLEMMSAVVQLHSMLIPIRCYPPELISDIKIARRYPIARPFHYDLSPDQFMTRPGSEGASDEVVLIDFNASRTAKMEYSNFSWQTIPGKDYYQAPERRGHNARDTDTLGIPVVFQSNPIYDLYSLMIIGLFGLAREHDWEQRVQQHEGWETLPAFYQFLFAPDLSSRLQALFAGQQGVEFAPLCELMEAVLQHDPSRRYEQLCTLPGLHWGGLKDWMLLPRATDFVARQVMGRDFRVAWKKPLYECNESTSAISLLSLLDREGCRWTPGPWEQGRINHPAMQVDQLFFLQAEDTYPLIRGGVLEPRQAGHYTVYAMWGGCIDFAHPLQVEVHPDRHAEATKTGDSSAYPFPNSPTKAELQPIQPPIGSPAPSTAEHNHPALAPTPPMSQPGHGILAPAQHRPLQEAPGETRLFNREPQPGTPRSQPEPPRADTQEAPLLQTIATTPPTGPNRTMPPQIEILAVTADRLSFETPDASAPATIQAPDLRQWEHEIPTCTDHQRIDFMENFLQQLPQDTWVKAMQSNLCARRCQLYLDAGNLRPESPSLQRLARRLAMIDGADIQRGILLNNLAVCCYESAYHHQRLPDWQKLFGFEPTAQLKSWLNHTDPAPHRRPSAWIYEVRERSRETLAYCHKIHRRLS